MNKREARHRKSAAHRRLIFILILAALCVALMIGKVSGALFSDGAFQVGLYESSRPLTFLDEKKTVSGFEADLARMLAERLERKLKIKILKPEDLAGALESGSVDCVLSVRESVHNLIDRYRSTEPFISYGVVAVASPAPDAGTAGGGEAVLDEAALRGARAGVLLNSDAELLCEELLKRVAFDVRKYDVEAQPFQDLKLRRNEFVFADELYARFMQAGDPESYQTLEPVYFRKQYGLRLSRKISQDYAQDIESALLELKSDVALKTLYLEWFGYDLS
jgi:ABC-type amino acid transport substrate-binding protein